MRRLLWLLVVASLSLSACTALWAQAISHRISEDLLALKSYRGELVERGLLADPKAELKKRVLYQKPWKVRVEVTSPAEREGDLYLYDGSTLTLWWPKELFGVRVAGVPAPGDEAIRAHLEAETKHNLEHYAFHLIGETKVAGQSAARWKVIPKAKAPFRYVHHSWMHSEHSFPLRMDFYRDGEKELWYAMEFRSLELPTQVEADAFAFEFPPNAVVFEWDWRDEAVSLEAARPAMNFTLRTLKAPPGFRIDKSVRGRHDLPMLATRARRGASWLSLTQNRNYAGTLSMPVGKRVRIGEAEGYLNFMGAYAVVSWTLGDTQLTLVGNLSFPQLLEVAAAVR